MSGPVARADERSLWLTVGVGWAIAAAVLVLTSAHAIATLLFPDPDDAMRMLQVRDWLGGQSWWDVGQHRLNGGDFPMHWSRLVDLPIALAMLAGDLFLDRDLSTRVAITVVPLLTLLIIMAQGAALTRRVSDAATARMAVLLTPLSVPIIYQARPLRIDHHGWQVVLAMAAALLLVRRPTPVRGALMGASLGVLLTVSLEGMPMAVVILAVAGVGWALDPGRRAFLLSAVWSLWGVAVALHVATRGPGMFAAACDAMSPAWLGVLGVAAVGVSVATTGGGAHLSWHLSSRLSWRLFGLGATGVACLSTLIATAPKCGGGPFASLPPVVYHFWYLNVLEGRPLWEQQPSWAFLTIGMPVVGLIGGASAWRAAAGADRGRWAVMLVLQVAALALALLVSRAGATANALALPGASSLLLALLTRARAIGPVLPRTAATAGALVLASPGQAAGFALTLAHLLSPAPATVAREGGAHRTPCEDSTDTRVVDGLPIGTLFAPIDISPAIIATTRQHAIAGGYHRGAAAMERVTTAFTTTPDRARPIIEASGAAFVVACPGFNEVELYRLEAPDGLWARLERGERFAWLRPVPIAGSPMLVWRVVRRPDALVE